MRSSARYPVPKGLIRTLLNIHGNGSYTVGEYLYVCYVSATPEADAGNYPT